MSDEITESRLMAAFHVPATLAADIAVDLENAAVRWEINGVLCRCAWLAQIAHESQNFTRRQENLNYRASRLPVVWPSRFRMPMTSEEALLVVYPDGKANPEFFAHNPQALANLVYANRMGNGDEASGDGWIHRGQGFIQLTGKNNITTYFKRIGWPGADPSLLQSTYYACDSAGYFWASINGNDFVKRDDFRGLTKKINGALLGIEERTALFIRAKQVFAG